MYQKITENGYITGLCRGTTNGNISEEEYGVLLGIIRRKPTAEQGFDYRLKEDLAWELYELPIADEETTSYTEEELTAMTNAELQAICEELGISSSMTKANMVELILSKQNA